MIQKAKSSSRRSFLTTIPIAIASLGMFSFLKLNKRNRYAEVKYNTLPSSEADKILKESKIEKAGILKPLPAPLGAMNIN